MLRSYLENVGGVLDDLVALRRDAGEALGGQADGLLVAADLHDGDAVDVELDALGGHGVADADLDLLRRQVEHGQLLHERHDEDAAAGDDLLAGQVTAGLALAASHDERLVGLGDLVAGDDGQGGDDDQCDQADDGKERDGVFGHGVFLLSVIRVWERCWWAWRVRRFGP